MQWPCRAIAHADRACTHTAHACDQVRLGEDGVEDEVLPYIAVGATEATLMDAPAPNDLARLRRQQIAGGASLHAYAYASAHGRVGECANARAHTWMSMAACSRGSW